MDVNDYLEKGINGGPVLKADEKRRYLGNFYERCYLTVTKKELALPYLWDALEKECADHEACLFMNQALASSLQTKAMAICQQHQREFMLVTSSVAMAEDTVMMVYATDHAVHIPSADIETKYHDVFATPVVEPDTHKKEGFFKRLFKK